MAMAKRPPRPAGMPWVSTYLTVRDVDAAIAFYQKAFGFEKRMTLPGPDGKTAHGEVAWHDMVVMMGREGAQGQACQSPVSSGVQCPIGLYVYVDDVDNGFKRAVEAGGQPKAEPVTMFWGDRIATVQDPDGYGWTLATNVTDLDPSKMPSC